MTLHSRGLTFILERILFIRFEFNFRALPVLLLLLIAPIAFSKEAPSAPDIPHDYISCAFLTLEQLTILQLAQRGINQETALETLPLSRAKAKDRIKTVYNLLEQEGILNAYSVINSNYARCAKLVYEAKGTPAKDLLEYPYYFCAGENKIRYEIILRINQSFDIDKVLSETPDSHFDVAIQYFKLVENKGLLASFDYTANNLKACVQQIQ